MDSIIERLQDIIGKDNVLTGEYLKDRYNHIWRMDEPLKAKAILLPKTTKDISIILKLCNTYHQAIVIHGGLTNLVGSTETQEHEIIISTERMNQIEEVDEKSRTITVQAGAILERIQEAASEKGLLFPLSFGAKGSARMGGIISTNAGGLRVFRYGMTRNLVLGLEVVLADGTIISSMKKIIKDNSAYDLKQMFIGSEGTLGVITKAVMKLVEAPKSRVSAFVGINDYDRVVDFLKHMDSGLAGTLSSYELIWGDTYHAMTSPPALAKPPLPYDYEYYVLLDCLGSHQENDQERLEELLGEALERALIEDATIAKDSSDLNWFWTIREDVHVLKSQCIYDHHFDISMPIPRIGSTINEMQQKLKKLKNVQQIFTFGHIADGNIHFIIGKENKSKELSQKINDIVYRPLKNLGGSVSAEHGIGLDKKSYLHLCRTKEEIQLMKTLKKTLDPNGILNQGKVL